ncbi:hypothetical protein BLA3211_00927 [Burkholderia aenigmatica]|uniref:Uncharacterized protein n=1 Tax=Burkholderia aenigmatica TaxID=2015348 RepID=A0A6J5ILR7_9BURK|nr:hypothetical protein BLA3211_00927 [Burkholderia aenigmatica]
MEGTIARSMGCLRANGLAARPRGEGAHFTGSGGANRKKWRKRERDTRTRPDDACATACNTARTADRAWRLRDDIQLKRSARMLHECGVGGACAQTHLRGRCGCPAAACSGHSSVQAVADIGLSCAEAVPPATVILRCGGDCGFCVKDCKTPSHKPASLSRIDTPRMHTPAGNCRRGGVAVRAGRAVKCGQGRCAFGQARPIAIARCGFVRKSRRSAC